jgi:hypothetical protein
VDCGVGIPAGARAGRKDIASDGVVSTCGRTMGQAQLAGKTAHTDTHSAASRCQSSE